MDIKYCALITERNVALKAALEIEKNAFLEVTQLEGFLEKGRADHWKKWLGSLLWDRLSKSCLMLVGWTPAKTPGVLDQENLELTAKTNAAWYGLLLCEAQRPYYGECRVITGEAKLTDGRIHSANIRETFQKDSVARPFYEFGNGRFFKTYPNYSDVSWLESWRDVYVLLENRYRLAGLVTSIVEDALESFKDAKAHNNPATAIARYVEAAEAVLAMPRGNCGKLEFAKRASAILSPYGQDPYLGWDESELSGVRLVEVYNLRNARNHGKGMRDAVNEILKSDDAKTIDMALGKWLYLSEILARRAILCLLRHQDAASLITSRAGLEQAWATGAFPGVVSA